MQLGVSCVEWEVEWRLMRFLLVLSTLFLLTPPVFGQESKTIKTERIEGVICTNFSDWTFMVKAKEFWTPTKEQVMKAEEKIEEYLKNNPVSNAHDLWRKLPDYKRQYVGVIVDGHKRIFCNFYCWNKRLSDKPVFVFDGGACFFRIEYDVDNQKCYNFETNGDA